MKLTWIFLTIFIAYAFFYMFLIKLKIFRKKGRILSSVEILKLAEEGDTDAQSLKKRMKYFYILGFVFGLFFMLEKYNIINY
ncbi:MAG: hypothetical protein ACOH2K_17720 [Burkholderiaceae bacterium]